MAAAAAGSEAALATAPSSLMVGLQLSGRKAAVFGSGASAVTRATLALEAGADVVLYSADVAAALGKWAGSGRISTAAGASLAAGDAAAFSVVLVADGVASDAAVAIAQAARAGGAAVNVAGRADLSDFALVPSYRGGGGLQVAVTTNGVAPRVAQRLLREIVARLPADLEPQLGEVARLGAAAAAAERAHAAAAAKLEAVAASAADEAGLSTAATAAHTPGPASEAGDAAAAVDLGALRNGAAVTLDAQAAVAYAAHALSDLCFVYAAAEQPLGAAALAWSRRAEKNAFGGWVSALRMQTRGGAGHALWGALASGARVAALASGDSLAHMAGVLHELAAQRHALVVHAEAQTLDAAGEAHADHDAARAALATGAVVLASASPQEAHDVALVAHAVAAAARTPVVHVTSGAAQPAGVRTASHAQTALFVDAVAKAAGGSAGGAVDAAFALLRSTFGRTYARFEYSGPADAETVFVALGQPAAEATAALPALLRQGAAAGVLTVRALRPWDAAALAASLPGSARRIVVLPCTRGAAAGDALVADVALAALVGLPGRGVRVTASAVAGGADDVAAAMAAALGLEAAETEAAAAEEAAPAQAAAPPAESAAPALGETVASADVARMLAFPEAYGAHVAARPDERTHTVRVSAKYRMTPADYDRNIFHIEFDTRGTELTYEIGDALGVYGANDPALVDAFVAAYGLDGDQLVAAARDGGRRETRSVRGWLTHALDLFGRPAKAFYAALAECAADAAEAERLRWLTTADGAAEFRARVADTVTYADVLLEFASAQPSAQRLVALVAPIKPRHYSIASSARMHPGSVHLCVVAVEWRDSRGRRRAGQCTRFLDALAPGDAVVVSVKPSVMKLPPCDEQPVIMAGLGTGMAPFRAFIEERAVRQQQGAAVGPMTLYFGSRHRAMEYLYGEELEAYHAAGLLTNLRLAFSRDQRDKVYIQHRMRQDAALLADHMLAADGAFYLCGPTWPAADVKDAMVAAFTTAGGVRPADANKTIEDLKERERYILEVY
ncbi:sulfite reductase [NADPH] flavoprotein component [Coemansia interrupta]|uniref:Sulfite reductase [NADPH] flavoprotein component n=1 Tax=Coemansia interrupta TaxID=1126814 RepID=A0A9W8HHY5_9FUNG|nr:sulfite reductase [NADPH] flavoprotein component [Coemansia interrupta]